jgi:hypothetical protein
MWRRAIIVLASMAVLQSCTPEQPGSASAPEGAPGIIGEAIEVTTLDGPVAGASVAAAADDLTATDTSAQTRPKPRPGSERATEIDETGPDAAAPEAAAEASVAPEIKKSRDQVQCEKRGGRWTKFGKGDARTCVKTTRDGGKSCTKKADCQSECLARSMTCAPFDPLLGCNDVLQSDGRAVTLCLD